MGSFNKAALIGHLGQDPEARWTKVDKTYGLRRRYRRERVAELQRLGHRDDEVRLILSQDLG
jgi:single-stranded DNA-binding protein